VIFTASSLYMAYLFGVEVSWIWLLAASAGKLDLEKAAKE